MENEHHPDDGPPDQGAGNPAADKKPKLSNDELKAQLD